MELGWGVTKSHSVLWIFTVWFGHDLRDTSWRRHALSRNSIQVSRKSISSYNIEGVLDISCSQIGFSGQYCSYSRARRRKKKTRVKNPRELSGKGNSLSLSHIPPNFWPCSLDYDVHAVKLIIIHSTGEADLSQIVPPWALLTELSHFQETGPSSEGASVAQLCRPLASQLSISTFPSWFVL